ncbi:MAG: hypothetical protein JO022_17415 [Acidobacteriaceae bacterium]|nr:hypothetical protein [Acidobacteriaceae bacterium]
MLLLVVSFLCLGSWANTLKLAGPRWRFELFYFDFAIGALALALIAAFTLGTQGAELSFNDRIAVAGLRSQAWAIGSGFVFGLGNMLLIAAISLAGMAAAYPLVLGLALLVSSFFSIGQANNIVSLAAGLALIFVAVLFGAAALKANRQSPAHAQLSSRGNRSTKALIAGVIAGVIIGISSAISENAFWGDLGLGAYAGTLMFCIGLVIATGLFSPFFMNIAIEGGRLTFASYLKGTGKQHLLGLAGGALWAAGLLCTLLAQSVPAAVAPTLTSVTLWSYGAVLLAIAWGTLAWREFAASRKNGLILIALTAILFAAGLFAVAHVRI